MSRFFRKVAGAFVEFKDEEPPKADAATATLDEITKDASDLLAQLEKTGAAGGSVDSAGEGAAGAARYSVGEGSALRMTAEDVFAAAGLADGPNSARRVLKIIAGLTMFPRSQQVLMVRAMDSADESWSEASVLEDARARQSVLRTHIEAVAQERADRVQGLRQKIADEQARGQAALDDIDRQITELQAQRKQTIEQTTGRVAELDNETRQLDEAAEEARRGITRVVNALSDLITFFSAAEGTSSG